MTTKTDATPEVDQHELIQATSDIMAFCQEQGMTELLAYMAMTYITKTMEEKLGFGSERRTNA